MAGAPFTVLTVCTGNVCRSPLAERLLAARLAGAPITVASAGVTALVGMGIDGPSALALAELGIDPAGHRARQLEPDTIRLSDLVLTATRAHRSAVLAAVPAAAGRCFTLREFARLGAGIGPLRPPLDRQALIGRVRMVAERRLRQVPPRGGRDEIGDPFGATPAQARATARTIAETVDAVVAALGVRDGV